MPREIELKLTIAEADLPRLKRSRLLASVTRSRPTTRTLHNIYFDTPGHELSRLGVALRLRRVGSRWVQTLKTAGDGSVGLHARGEFETAVPAPLLDFVALAATPAAELFADPQFRARLAPVFMTDFRRTARVIEAAPGTTAEFAVDLGAVVAGDARTPIRELEIELASGAAPALYRFAQRLLDDVPFTLETVSKAERGYALLSPVEPKPVKAVPAELRPDMAVHDAFAAIIGSCIAQLMANADGVRTSDDPEYIHQARVAIRRLRSAFSLFRDVVPKSSTADLLSAARAFGTLLGAARDLDVLATETLPAVASALPDDADPARLAASLAPLRTEARITARAAFAATGYTRWLLALGEALAARDWRTALDADGRAYEALPLPEFAGRLLDERLKRVRKRGRKLRERSAEELHQLRIELKKLRYAVDFFQPLYPRKAVKAWLGAAAALQEVLGHLNDAAVTQHLLGTMPDDPALARARGLVAGWAAARAQGGLDTLEAAWSRFEDAATFW